MSIGFRILPAARAASPALLDRFRDVPAAHASDSMSRLFGAGAGLRPMHRVGTPPGGGPEQGKLVGNALTVRVRPGDNLMVHKAIDMAAPRDVIVVDAGGELSQAIIGEMMMRHAQKRGVAGFVIDGAVRDLATIGAEDFPVYAAGVTHRGPFKEGPGEINLPVAVGGMVVNPGDIMIGDADGVVAIPLAEAEAVLARCLALRAAEDSKMAEILAGTVNRAWVDAELKARGFTA